MRPTPWQKRFGPAFAWGVLGLLLAWSFCLDFENVAQGGAIDLRNRITGARLLAHGIDPYFYKWHEPEPPEYCDPYNNPLLPVSKTTATPALLLVHLPFALLPYRLGQFLWFFAQWLLLLGAAWLWFRRCAAEWQRLMLAVFVTGFTYTAAWRLHAERGQSYVLLMFLLAVWLAVTREAQPERIKTFLAGMLAGFLVALRPPFLLLAPFLLLHRRSQLPGAAVGLLLGIILPMFCLPDAWMKYSSAMTTHSALYRAGIDPAPPPESFPAQIEGISTDLLGNYVAIPYADFSIHALLRVIGWEPFPSWPPLLAALAAYGGWLAWSRGQPMYRLLLGVAIWLFLADFFLPAYRNNYNDVLILNVVALGLIVHPRLTWGVGLCLLALPVGWGIAIVAPMHDALINLPSALLTLGAILLLFLFNNRAGVRKVEKGC
jgi:hypothetical protein